jgi:ribulose-phosphate 3-epimerase
MSHLISPSILTANFLDLRSVIEMINKSEADWLHLDIMDGAFVPNMTFGFPVIRQINEISTKPLDVHLMIIEPEKHIEEFQRSGADILTIHYEACSDLDKTLDHIKSLGMKTGVSIKPATPPAVLEPFLTRIDMVLNMTVEPGFGAQAFIEESYEKITELKSLIRKTGSETLIQVDGGVGFHNLVKLRETGVDVFVTGNTVFAAEDPLQTISDLKKL